MDFDTYIVYVSNNFTRNSDLSINHEEIIDYSFPDT